MMILSIVTYEQQLQSTLPHENGRRILDSTSH